MKRVAVFGLGRFGSSVATTLSDEGMEVLAIDSDLALVQRLKDDVALAVSCDATSREELVSLEVGRMDVAVVAIGDDFESSVLITLLCKELGVPYVVAKALSHEQQRVLMKVGADEVVLPEEQMGRWVAENLLRHSIVNLVELPDGYGLGTVALPDEWAGQTLGELGLIERERLNLVQVHRPTADGGEKAFPLPSGSFRLESGDLLDVIGPNAVLERYSQS
jgi:trk system potassium uptake protein TrkA